MIHMKGTAVFRVYAAKAICIFFPCITYAQVAMPEKDEWKMHDGVVVRGKAYSFGYHQCFLQRRAGKILLNGQKIANPKANALLTKLCEEKGVPLDDPKHLQEILAKQHFAQIILPFYTLKYHNAAGRDEEVPTILLAPEETQELRPVFEAWLAEKRREHEEQMQRAQELQNQQAMLEMQAQALLVQQDIARSAARNAAANEANAAAQQDMARSSARNAAANEANAAAQQDMARSSARNAAANEANAAANRKKADEIERIRRNLR